MSRHNPMPGAGVPVTVVTGASAGVGRAIANAFAGRGDRVALLARGADGLAGARREIEAAGGECMTLEVDVADADAVESAADEIVQRWGRIDIWVNNAMVTVYGPIDSVTTEEFRRVTEVSYLGTVHGTRAALRHMRKADSGTIVQIGSALAYRSIPLQSAYCAAKAAARAFTDSLRSELIHEGSNIGVTMCHLPGVNTPQFDWARSHLPRRLQPVPPIHQPEAIAARVVQASEDLPRELWIGTASFKAILGTRLVPGLLDHMMAKQAWSGQMTKERAKPNRPDNLEGPVAGDFGAHGRFDRRATDHAIALSDRQATWLAAGAGFAFAALVGAALTSGARRAPPPRRLVRR